MIGLMLWLRHVVSPLPEPAMMNLPRDSHHIEDDCHSFGTSLMACRWAISNPITAKLYLHQNPLYTTN